MKNFKLFVLPVDIKHLELLQIVNQFKLKNNNPKRSAVRKIKKTRRAVNRSYAKMRLKRQKRNSFFSFNFY